MAGDEGRPAGPDDWTFQTVSPVWKAGPETRGVPPGRVVVVAVVAAVAGLVLGIGIGLEIAEVIGTGEEVVGTGEPDTGAPSEPVGRPPGGVREWAVPRPAAVAAAAHVQPRRASSPPRRPCDTSRPPRGPSLTPARPRSPACRRQATEGPTDGGSCVS